MSLHATPPVAHPAEGLPEALRKRAVEAAAEGRDDLGNELILAATAIEDLLPRRGGQIEDLDWFCANCWAHVEGRRILLCVNPFRADDEITGCPECGAANSFIPLDGSSTAGPGA